MSDSALVRAAGRARIQRTEHVMGMPVIVEVCDDGVPEAAVDRVFRWLRYVDETFSTYSEASEISRLNRGEIGLADASLAVRAVLEHCERLRKQTNGYFDIRACTPAGGLDPSGFVKGWSVGGAARLLEQSGARDFCINAGGDIVTRGEAPQGGSWRVGIAHPCRADAVACTVMLTDTAIATSGTYARGAHIIDPHQGAPPSGLLSVTAIGRDLAVADAYATAAFAMGDTAPEWCARREDIDFMLVTDREEVLTTLGFERYRADEAPA
jgi:thiamine biosynthesis lipoprotein